MDSTARTSRRIAIVSPMVVGYGMTPDTYSSQQLNLASRWAEAGHQVDLFTLRGQGLESADLPAGVDVHSLPGGYLGPTGLPLMRGVRSSLKGKDYDLILASEHYQPATAMACMSSDRVIIYQGQNAPGASARARWFLRVMDGTLGRITRQRCMGVVAKTPDAADFLLERGYSPVVVVPCGYDERRFTLPSPEERKRSRQALGVTDGEHVFVYAGNLIPRRDLETALRAVALLKARGHSVRFYLAGHGPEQLALERLAKALGIAAETIFAGLLSWQALRELYWGGDLFLFTARYEIYGLVVPEAMACGLLVASTPVGAGNTVISDGVNGLQLPIADPSAIAERLDPVLGDSRLQAQMRQAAQATLADHTWAAVAGRILDVADQMRVARVGLGEQDRSRLGIGASGPR